MNDKYIIRHAESSDDIIRLRELFTEIFHPQDVGTLAETISNHLPRMKKDYWFIAEDKDTSVIASAFVLIPWTWEMEGIQIRTAEMGIVGTRQKYRNQGLMRRLYQVFDHTLKTEGFDISVVQGIPGFYHNFGHYYSVPLENHIDLPLHVIPDIIPDKQEKDAYTFRRAVVEDIPYLMQEDEKYRKSVSVSVFRDAANWEYLLNRSIETEYGAAFYIIENTQKHEKFYARIPFAGFGKGLIISEISVDTTCDALLSFFIFCKQKAIKQDKPYIRLNLHNDSNAGRMAISMGAKKGTPYAWQIRIPDVVSFLKKMTPIFEKRMNQSSFVNFSGTIRLDFFKTRIDMLWNNGRLASVEPGGDEACQNTFCISPDLFPALCLGHRTWQELQYVRPDIFPASEYVRPEAFIASEKVGLLVDVLFPGRRSWVYEEY